MDNKKCMTKKKEKSIPIKKHLLAYMAEHYSDFLFQGSVGKFYAFRKENADGIYDYIIMQRDFFEGTIDLVITEVASCYNTNWRGIPWFTVGYETDIAVLITGKNCYNADIGWHHCKNNIDELPGLFACIKKDIDTYVLPFFAKTHTKISSNKSMSFTNAYMQEQFLSMSENEIVSIKQYLVELNQEYSKYCKECKKNGQKEELNYFDVLPIHETINQWLNNIQKSLNYTYLSKDMRIQLIKYITVLFRDKFDFYNLGTF